MNLKKISSLKIVKVNQIHNTHIHNNLIQMKNMCIKKYFLHFSKIIIFI